MIPHGWTEGFTAFLRNGRMANQVAALQMKKAKAKLPGSITNPRLAVLHLALSNSGMYYKSHFQAANPAGLNSRL